MGVRKKRVALNQRLRSGTNLPEGHLKSFNRDDYTYDGYPVVAARNLGKHSFLVDVLVGWRISTLGVDRNFFGGILNSRLCRTTLDVSRPLFDREYVVFQKSETHDDKCKFTISECKFPVFVMNGVSDNYYWKATKYRKHLEVQRAFWYWRECKDPWRHNNIDLDSGDRQCGCIHYDQYPLPTKVAIDDWHSRIAG